MNIPSQETFEKYVPAFRDADSRIYDAVKPHMMQYIHDEIEPLQVPDDFPKPERIDEVVCLNAAYRAVPGMDLVPTESGFAVVSNGNLAPASRDRVEALRQSLRLNKSDARDMLLFALYEMDDWRFTEAARRLRTTLLWCPTLCRRYGITAEGRRMVLEEEFAALSNAILTAHVMVETIVSPEQMAWLLANQDEYDDTDDIGDMRRLLREHCRALMAAHVRQDKRAIRVMMERVKSFLDQYGEYLTEYKNSRTRLAAAYEPYQNKQDDACFFFG